MSLQSGGLKDCPEVGKVSLTRDFATIQRNVTQREHEITCFVLCYAPDFLTAV